MHRLSTIQTTATENNLVIPTATEQLSIKEQDILYSMLSDLTNDLFKAWYCTTFKRLGREKTMNLASLARADGKDPRKYFSYLLKNHA